MKQVHILSFKNRCWIHLGLYLCFCACQNSSRNSTSPLHIPTADAKTVTIRSIEHGYTLSRLGEPYVIKGATIAEDKPHLLSLANAGGNTVRTYTSAHAQVILDSAEMLGLGVMLGLYLMPAEYGMDYGNEKKVQQQQDSLLQIVKKWKHHPALLLWGLGNEVELHSSDPAIWSAINSLSQAIQKEDPNHPTVSVILPNAKSLKQFTQHCPNVDILGINSFGSLATISEQLSNESYPWKGPILFTEWGVPGPWESPHTNWRAPIEWTNREKIHFLQKFSSIIQDQLSQRCLGGFVFFWGQKLEGTHSWFSIFGEDGEATPMFDQLVYLWRDRWPANRAPIIDSLGITHFESGKQLYFQTGEPIQAKLLAHDHENQSMQCHWMVLPELTYPQNSPVILNLPLDHSPLTNQQTWIFNAPEQVGAYRIYVEVRDSLGKISSANLPFFVSLRSPIHPLGKNRTH